MKRRGMVLALVLGLVLVLIGFGSVLRLLTGSAAREVDAVADHLRAISVGEAAFAEVVARLVAGAWSARWFKDGPDVQRDVKVAGGAYSYVIAQVGPEERQQADLLVRATYDHTTVVMAWRLTMPRDSVDSVARVIPSFFANAPPNTEATPGALNPISERIDQWQEVRRNNKPRTDALRGPLEQATDAGGVGDALGDPGANAVDEVRPPDGGAPRPNGGYRRRAREQAGAPPGLPPPPAVPPTVLRPGTNWPNWPGVPRPSVPPRPPKPMREAFADAQVAIRQMQIVIEKLTGPAGARGGPFGAAVRDEAQQTIGSLRKNFGVDENIERLSDSDPNTPAQPDQLKALAEADAVMKMVDRLPLGLRATIPRVM